MYVATVQGLPAKPRKVVSGASAAFTLRTVSMTGERRARFRFQIREAGVRQRRGQARASLAGFEPQILPERMGDNENVGKEDRAIETEAPDRLERDLAGGIAVIAKLEETALLRAQFAIFRQNNGPPGASARAAARPAFLRAM